MIFYWKDLAYLNCLKRLSADIQDDAANIGKTDFFTARVKERPEKVMNLDILDEIQEILMKNRKQLL